MEIKGVEVVIENERADYTMDEIERYVDRGMKMHTSRRLEKMKLKFDGDNVEITYNFAAVPFERIRRITGYLVGTMDRWNNAKAAEEHDRVKHAVNL